MRAHDARPHGLDVVGAVDVAVTLERGDGGEDAFRGGRGFLGNAVLRNAAGDECQGEGGDHRCEVLHRVILLLLWESSETGGKTATPNPRRGTSTARARPLGQR